MDLPKHILTFPTLLHPGGSIKITLCSRYTQINQHRDNTQSPATLYRVSSYKLQIIILQRKIVTVQLCMHNIYAGSYIGDQ